jgi:hypothetical protein
MINDLTNNWKPEVRIHRKWFNHLNDPTGTLAQVHYQLTGTKILVDEFKVHVVLDGVIGPSKTDVLFINYPDVHDELLNQTVSELYTYIKNGEIS